MRRSVFFAWFVLVLLVLLAVTSSAASAASPRAATPLRGTNWVLTDRVSLGTSLDGVAVNAVFGAKRVDGSSGCNGYSSSYTVTGSRMTIVNDGVSTQIACGGAADQVERKYRAALPRVGRFRIDGTTLTLSTRAGRRLLVYRASRGQQALRGTWDVTSFYAGDAISSPPAGSSQTLAFDSARVSGNGGCNSFSGPYQLSGADGIGIGPLAQTQRGCQYSDAEQQYVAALQLATAYQVTGNRLTLFRDGGTIAATFERAAQ